MRLALLALAACGLPEADFEQGRLEAQCAVLYDCTAEADHAALPYDDEADCADPDGLLPEEDAERGCSYDPSEAESCLEQWQALDCESWRAGQTPTCNPWTC